MCDIGFFDFIYIIQSQYYYFSTNAALLFLPTVQTQYKGTVNVFFLLGSEFKIGDLR